MSSITESSRRRLLLLSNSRNPGGEFLRHVHEQLTAHFAGVKRVLFVPYAGVTISWDAYTALVRDAFASLGIEVTSVHETANPVDAVKSAEAIAIGGGNTFHLLAHLQRAKLPALIHERVMAGVPYMGWSAGSVVACPTLQTTNDMPIIEPESFAALGLVGFQINAHFTDAHPPGFNGETRRQRLAEYVLANRDVTVIGLPEGTWLDVKGPAITLHGSGDSPVFRADAVDQLATRNVDLAAILEG